jgi:hypothetical protein
MPYGAAESRLRLQEAGRPLDVVRQGLPQVREAGHVRDEDRLEAWMLVALIVGIALIAGSLWALVELLDLINPPPSTLAPVTTAG